MSSETTEVVDQDGDSREKKEEAKREMKMEEGLTYLHVAPRLSEV